MRLHIRHRTHYQYSTRVSFGEHQLRIRPREGQGVHLEKVRIDIFPDHRIRWMRDLHDNNVGIVDFTEAADELVFDCEFIVGTRDENPFNFVISPEAVEYPFLFDHDLYQELHPLIRRIYFREEARVRQWLEQIWHPGKRINTLELLQELNGLIYRTLTYRRREARGVQSPAETIERGSGSCRDFACLFMEACRTLGLPARFVSGYMYSSEITGRMSMHAWTEVFLPGAGWIGFDPSWGILASSQYVPASVSRHPEHSPPISGTFIGVPRSFLKCEVDLYIEEAREDQLDPVSV